MQPSRDIGRLLEIMAALRTPEWTDALNSIPGYRAERSGEVLSLRSVLPWWSYRKPKA